jgi:membrane-bound serine protease (ClpP class)
MIGQTGRALTAIEPGHQGRVTVHGEIWQARAAEPIPPGTPIRVADMDGLTLIVHTA